MWEECREMAEAMGKEGNIHRTGHETNLKRFADKAYFT
jgi:hypothetical protein